MRRCVLPLIAAAATAVLAAGLTVAPVATAAPSTTVAPNPRVAHRNAHVCARPAPGLAACDAILHETLTAGGVAVRNAAISGYGPADLNAAYHLSSSGGAGRTVAVVDAYNDPSAAADLAVYRHHFGLSACTTPNGCLRIVGQTGSTRLPRTSAAWSQEISLDLDMVSAICPHCHILLVEASTASLRNLGTAVDAAAGHGADEISNSYGGSESSSDAGYDTAYYDHPGIAVTASTGDSGYGVEYPAASRYVTATGGTTLTDIGGTFHQTAWSSAGSGCSADDSQPGFQRRVANISRFCAQRAVADVSADADPDTGVAVYDSRPYQGQSGWLDVGGTSVASPVIAAVYALAGDYSGSGAATVYGRATPANITDVTSGSNGSCGTDLCNATRGWDGPTGLGTPDGDAAF